MKAIVHIGMPKAGSSSIQAFLYRNAAALADQGFRFHRNIDGRGSQFEYVQAALCKAGALLPTRKNRIRYRARTLEEQEKSATDGVVPLDAYPSRWSEKWALFSSEHMEPWLRTPELVGTMDEMFRNVFSEVRYVMYVRSPVDSIVSQYSEAIKRGATEPLENFIHLQGRRIDIDSVAVLWANAVGKERLDMRLLDRSFMKNGDLIEDFAEVCGFDASSMKRPPRVNESLSAPGAVCLRALNRLIPEVHPDGGRNPLRQQLLPAVMRFSADGPSLSLNREQRQRVEAAVAETNERFRVAFFPERPQLFESKSAPDKEPSSEEIYEMALDVLANVIVELRLDGIKPLNHEQKARSYVGQLDG